MHNLHDSPLHCLLSFSLSCLLLVQSRSRRAQALRLADDATSSPLVCIVRERGTEQVDRRTDREKAGEKACVIPSTQTVGLQAKAKAVRDEGRKNGRIDRSTYESALSCSPPTPFAVSCSCTGVSMHMLSAVQHVCAAYARTVNCISC